MRDRAAGVALRIAQYALVLVALAWLVSRVDWARTVALLSGAGAAVIVGVLAATGLEFVTRFSMWHVLLNGRGESRFSTAARIDLLIKFINHLVPSKASGHSVAPLVLRHFTDAEWPDAVSVAGLNTGLYSAIYGLVAFVGIAAFAGRLSPGLVAVLGLSTAMYLAIGAAILVAGRRADAAAGLFGRAGGSLGRLPVVGERAGALAAKLPSFTEVSVAAFRDLSGRPRVLVLYALAWSGTLLVGPGVRVWLLLSAMDATFSPAWLIPVALVTAYSVTLLPVTPGGIGVAEASATLVFVGLGLPHEAVVPVVFLDRILGVYLPVLLGWYPMARVDLSEIVPGRG